MLCNPVKEHLCTADIELLAESFLVFNQSAYTSCSLLSLDFLSATLPTFQKVSFIPRLHFSDIPLRTYQGEKKQTVSIDQVWYEMIAHQEFCQSSN